MFSRDLFSIRLECLTGKFLGILLQIARFLCLLIINKYFAIINEHDSQNASEYEITG